MKQLLIINLLILPFFSHGQVIEGIWRYEVLNTISGDYFGELIIEKEDGVYKGEIISHEESYYVEFEYIGTDSISIFSNVEGFIATISGKFKQEKFIGNVTIVGDPNIYSFLATKQPKEQTLKIVDSQSNEIISYATVIYGNEGTITNEEGLCKVPISTKEIEIIISAIGYKMDTFKINGIDKIKTLQLTPTNYSLPLIEVKAKGFSVQKIVEVTINKLRENYIQAPYNADLFYRYSYLNEKDSLTYQSETILKYFDSKGYQKRGWRNAASSRYAKAEQGRITVGKQKTDLTLRELGNIFVFWAHEPIVTNDNSIAQNSLNAYNYKLVGVKQFMGKDVFEVEFNCTNLKNRYTGFTSLKYMKGRMFINQEDYAIIRYEQEYLLDYDYNGKHPKKRGNLKERNIIKSSKIELFSKNDEGYYLDYAKVTSESERQNTLLSGEVKIYKGTTIEEYQYFRLTTKNVESLSENLFEVNNQMQYNQAYWEQFNIIMRDK